MPNLIYSTFLGPFSKLKILSMTNETLKLDTDISMFDNMAATGGGMEGFNKCLTEAKWLKQSYNG